MAQSISKLVASALSSFSKRLDAQPTFREATVTATSPIMVKFDTDTSPSPALCSLDLSLSNGDRVLTMTMNSFLWVLGRKNGNAGAPGTYAWTASPQAPEGGLLCNGQAVSRLEYARLFSLIGTVYGNGDGTTTFNVPNAQGRTLVHQSPIGQFSPLGAAPGAENHTLIKSELPNWESASAGSHSHGPNALDRFMVLSSGSGAARRLINRSSGDQYGWVSATQADLNSAATTDSAGSHTHVINSTGGHSHNNVQPSFVANLFIWT